MDDEPFPIVGRALASSPLPTDVRSDFLAAQSAAEDAIRGAQSVEDTKAATLGSLARALEFAVSGDAGKSLRLLADLERDALDENAAIRLRTYGFLASTLYHNYFPGSLGADSPELLLRAAGHVRAVEALEDAIPHEGEPLALERTLVSRLVAFPVTARYVISVTSGASTESRPDIPDSFFKIFDGSELAEAGLLLQGRLTGADLLRLSGAWDRALHEVYETRNAASSDVSRAVCDLILAEWHSAPASSMDAMNQTLRGTGGLDELTPATELKEARLEHFDEAVAERRVSSAREIFQGTGLWRGVARCELVQAWLFATRQNWEEAQHFASSAHQRFTDAGDRFGQSLSTTHRALYTAASDGTIDAEGAQQVGQWGAGDGSLAYAVGLGILASRMGRHFVLRLGDPERAARCYRWSALVFGHLGTPLHEVQQLVHVAETSTAMGAYARAYSELEEARACAEQVSQASPALQGLITEVNQRYHALAQKRMDADALLAYSDQLKRSKKSPEKRHRVATAQGKNTARSPLGAVAQEAISNLTELATLRVMGAHDTASIASAEAAMYRGRNLILEGRTQASAEQQFTLALDAADKLSGPLRYFLRGSVHAFADRKQEAVTDFTTYFSTQNRGWLHCFIDTAGDDSVRSLSKQLSLRTALGIWAGIAEYDRAAAVINELQALDGERFWLLDERPWETLASVAETTLALGDPIDAFALFDEAIRIIESRRNSLSRDWMRLSFSDSKTQRDIYLGAMRACLNAADAGDADAWPRALTYLERGKGRALLDLMQPTTALTAESDTPEVRRWAAGLGLLGALEQQLSLCLSDQSAAESVTRLREQIHTARNETQKIERAIATKNPALLRVATADPPDIESIAEALPVGTAIVEYAISRRELTCFIVDRNGVRDIVRTSADSTQLHGLVSRAYRNAAMSRSAAESLSGLLIDPIQRRLDSYEKLAIVPFGPLHRLAFHNLPFNGGFLDDAWTTSVLPSATLVTHLRDQRTPSPSVLSLGVPDAAVFVDPFDAKRAMALRALPTAALEAQTIGSLYASSTVLAPSCATNRDVSTALASADIIHLATHAVYSASNPLASAIVLREGETLTLHELMGMRLRAQLMVLSSCASGLGESTSGDENAGFTRGLLSAGVRQVVASLWPVLDSVAYLTMTRFHSAYIKGHSAAESLRAARTSIRALSSRTALDELASVGVPDVHLNRSEVTEALEKLQAPVHWSPFYCIGVP